MYGVPIYLPIKRFVGDTLIQVCLGVDGVHFVFGKAGTISVSGHWELHDSSGQLIDRAVELSLRKSSVLHAIFNQDVVAASVDPPQSFSLGFESGHRLTIFDNSRQFESFSIQPGNIFV